MQPAQQLGLRGTASQERGLDVVSIAQGSETTQPKVHLWASLHPRGRAGTQHTTHGVVCGSMRQLLPGKLSESKSARGPGVLLCKHRTCLEHLGFSYPEVLLFQACPDSFVRSFNNHVLGVYYRPSANRGTGDPAVTKN